MVGGLRFGLALLVTLCHLAGFAGGIGAISHVGFFAVFVFFVLSGYFISTVLRDTYKFNFGAFFTNRILKLYPQYYVVAAFTVLVVAFARKPISFHLVQKDWSISGDTIAFISNLFIVPFPFVLPSDSYILVPQAWSIGIEILCYLLLWLFIARSPRNALFVIMLASGYDAVTSYLGYGWGVRYYLLPAALLPFAIGSLMSWYAEKREKLSVSRLKLLSGGAFAVWILNMVLTGFIAPVGSTGYEIFFFLNLALASIMVFFLVDPRHRTTNSGFDTLLGKMSYPIFLTHWIVGFVIRRTFVPGIPFGELGITLFIIALPAILIAAYALVLVQERTFDPIREQIRRFGLKTASARRLTSR